MRRGLLVVLLVLGLFAVSATLSIMSVPSRPLRDEAADSERRAAADAIRQQDEAAERAQAEQAQAQIEKLVREGAVHSADFRRGEMRVEPLVWSGLDVYQKRNVLSVMNLASGGVGAKIRSNRSDEVLAEYSIWSGATINK